MTSLTPLRILILEPHIHGHHGAYLRWIVRGSLNHSCHLRLATLSQNHAHPAFRRLLDEFPTNFESTCLPGDAPRGISTRYPLHLFLKSWRWRRLFRKAYRDEIRHGHSPDLVFLPYLDECLYSLALFGSPFGKTPWAGIAMRPDFHRRAVDIPATLSRGSRIKEHLFRRLLKNPTLIRLYTIVEPLARHIENTAPHLAKRIRYLPDPADMPTAIPRAEARRALGIPESALLMLVYGVISLRKGLDALLDSAQQPEFPPNLHLLIAGEQDADASAFLAGANAHPLTGEGRLHVLNSHLDATLESQVFSAADMVWLGYRQHYGSSGVMVQAGQAGLPVVGCAEGMIGQTIQDKRLGMVLPLLDARQTAQAIRAFTDDANSMRRCGENGRLAYSSHTPANFANELIHCMAFRP